MNNSTEVASKPDIQTITFIVNTVFTCIGMIGIGATTNHLQIWKHIKSSKAYIVGVVVQMLLVPLIAWAMTAIFQLTISPSLAVMIQGCAPGGVLSNIIVFYADGNVDLSIAMTVSSTLLSLGFMPLWLFIFTKYAETTIGTLNIVVPFNVIGITVASLVIPIFIGMMVNYKYPSKAPPVSKILTAIGGLGIVSMVIASSILSGLPLDQLWNWKVFVIAGLMPLVCYLFGLLFSTIPRICKVNLTRADSQTLAIEIALQNVSVGAAVISKSFGGTMMIYVQMITFPFFYLLFQIGESILLIVLVRVLIQRGCIDSNSEKVNIVENEPKAFTGTTNPGLEE